MEQSQLLLAARWGGSGAIAGVLQEDPEQSQIPAPQATTTHCHSSWVHPARGETYNLGSNKARGEIFTLPCNFSQGIPAEFEPAALSLKCPALADE